jgi:hypothetical protein
VGVARYLNTSAEKVSGNFDGWYDPEGGLWEEEEESRRWVLALERRFFTSVMSVTRDGEIGLGEMEEDER